MKVLHINLITLELPTVLLAIGGGLENIETAGMVKESSETDGDGITATIERTMAVFRFTKFVEKEMKQDGVAVVTQVIGKEAMAPADGVKVD
ncbi:hypothetical protein Ab1vBOLIVR6_gp118c [Agrobacterium phage OLIVR6]|nr:hypothetical protein Ab1vBOLIVR6_gp118c [Agrobacterium phage OLIVR6]